MLRAWRSRTCLRDPDAARVWLFKIAANLWRDRLRRARRPLKQVELAFEDQQGRETSPERVLADREDVERALKAMDALPQRQREVLYLHACEQLSILQIAEVLDVSSDAVKASLSLARKAIRCRLKDICEEHFPTR